MRSYQLKRIINLSLCAASSPDNVGAIFDIKPPLLPLLFPPCENKQEPSFRPYIQNHLIIHRNGFLRRALGRISFVRGKSCDLLESSRHLG